MTLTTRRSAGAAQVRDSPVGKPPECPITVKPCSRPSCRPSPYCPPSCRVHTRRRISRRDAASSSSPAVSTFPATLAIAPALAQNPVAAASAPVPICSTTRRGPCSREVWPGAKPTACSGPGGASGRSGPIPGTPTGSSTSSATASAKPVPVISSMTSPSSP